MDLLNKQEGLTTSIQDIKDELKQTKEVVTKLVEADRQNPDQSEKMKRKYPSSLTVIF